MQYRNQYIGYVLQSVEGVLPFGFSGLHDMLASSHEVKSQGLSQVANFRSDKTLNEPGYNTGQFHSIQRKVDLFLNQGS